jgi:Fic family protein
MRGVISGEYYGCFRNTEEGIFDRMGNAVYHAPPAKYVRELISELVRYLNSSREKLNPVKAILAHLVLEKIHPFVDGSGRVGRLLQFAVMVSQGYGMKGLAYVEEYIDKNRPLYYHAIENSSSADSTEFVELMTDFLAQATTAAKDRLIDRMKNFEKLDLLPPRRRELVQIIRDHQMVSLDFLHRRFLEIAPRLLRYDLFQLAKDGHIKKLGRTRGALYAPK